MSGIKGLAFDSEGFLRRECPHCELEFKWLPSESETEIDSDGYHCPYCDAQAGIDAWWTKAQLKQAEIEAGSAAEQELHSAFKKMERSSSKYVKIKAGPAPRRPMRAPLTEPDDMRRVDFVCHPGEPLKVLEDWAEPVHCLVCGQIAA